MCPADICYNKNYLKHCEQSMDSVLNIPTNTLPSVKDVQVKLRTLTDRGIDDEFEAQKSRRCCHKDRDNVRPHRISGIEDSQTALINGDSFCQDRKISCSRYDSVNDQELMVIRPFNQDTPMLEDMTFFSITGGCQYVNKWQPNSSGIQVYITVQVMSLQE